MRAYTGGRAGARAGARAPGRGAVGHVGSRRARFWRAVGGCAVGSFVAVGGCGVGLLLAVGGYVVGSFVAGGDAAVRLPVRWAKATTFPW
ncbi:hypothetical protein SAMN04487980_100494 [Streptomyces sp. cf124]|nr:hypothetical protein SAMN04487980_100494 [Streptomyces sp. cf124]